MFFMIFSPVLKVSVTSSREHAERVRRRRGRVTLAQWDEQLFRSRQPRRAAQSQMHFFDQRLEMRARTSLSARNQSSSAEPYGQPLACQSW
jgi:hypothetical protein